MTRTRKGAKKLDTYQICVTIIEAKHLEQNTNPMVVVRVGSRKKKTAIRKTTDNPYYNEVRKHVCFFRLRAYRVAFEWPSVMACACCD